jgi:D-mannonate dehydratase
MLEINQSKKFKKDLAQYKRDIEQIANDSVKQDCYNMLNKLKSEYSYIDSAHSVINKSIDPTQIRENVERSIALRQKLNKIIKYSKDL